jgi:hypothetical protein
MVEVSRSGSARRTIFCRNVRQSTARIARIIVNTPTYGFIQRSVLSKSATADETLSTAVVHTDRAGIRCFAGLSPSIQLRRSMRSVF